jgi:hypothetical protein
MDLVREVMVAVVAVPEQAELQPILVLVEQDRRLQLQVLLFCMLVVGAVVGVQELVQVVPEAVVMVSETLNREPMGRQIEVAVVEAKEMVVPVL